MTESDGAGQKPSALLESGQSGGDMGPVCAALVEANTHERKATIRLLGRAAREGWPISDNTRLRAPAILADIIEKEKKTVGSMIGPIEVDATMERIHAIRTLVAMDASNQSDLHKAVDLENPKAGLTVPPGLAVRRIVVELEPVGVERP